MPVLPQSAVISVTTCVAQDLEPIYLVTGPTSSVVTTDDRLAQHAVAKGCVDAAVDFLTEIEESMWNGSRDLNLIDRSGDCWDDISGEVLDRDSVLKARLEEVEDVRKHEVYEVVPVEQSGNAQVKDQ